VSPQRLVSVFKMATVLEECTIKEQRSVMLFCGQKESMQRIFIKECFLCLLCKAVHMWVNRFSDGRSKVADIARLGATVKRLLCCGFRRPGKTMGQVYQC
jgi:hypothetical protein